MREKECLEGRKVFCIEPRKAYFTVEKMKLIEQLLKLLYWFNFAPFYVFVYLIIYFLPCAGCCVIFCCFPFLSFRLFIIIWENDSFATQVISIRQWIRKSVCQLVSHETWEDKVFSFNVFSFILLPFSWIFHGQIMQISSSQTIWIRDLTSTVWFLLWVSSSITTKATTNKKIWKRTVMSYVMLYT